MNIMAKANQAFEFSWHGFGIKTSSEKIEIDLNDISFGF